MSVKDIFSAMVERLDEGFIRSNIYQVEENSLIARAIKNIAPELQEKILRSIPANRADEVKVLLAEDISDESSEAAQVEILSLTQGMV